MKKLTFTEFETEVHKLLELTDSLLEDDEVDKKHQQEASAKKKDSSKIWKVAHFKA